MSHIRNVYSYLPVAVGQFNTVKSIVDIFAAGWIDGEDGEVTQVGSAWLQFDFVVCGRKTRQYLSEVYAMRGTVSQSLFPAKRCTNNDQTIKYQQN